MNIRSVFSEAAIVILGGTLVFVANATFDYLTGPHPVERLRPGDIINKPQFLPAFHKRTFVIVGSSSSSFTNESLPFQRHLVNLLAQKGISSVILVPDEQSYRLYNEFGSLKPTVAPAAIAAIGLEGYPAIVEVESNNAVVGLWQGYIRPSSQRLIFAKIDGDTHILSASPHGAIKKVTPWTDNTGEQKVDVVDETPQKTWDTYWRNLVHVQSPAQDDKDDAEWAFLSESTLTRIASNAAMIDVRPRADYARSHDPRSINIPIDELAARSSFEFEQDAHVIIDCNQTEVSACDLAASILATNIQASALILDRGSVELTCRRDPLII
jgi:rhodanese-related sulfurtransferase